MVAEQAHHLLRFALTQQAVIDEDAGEVFADRFMDQHGGHRRIDAAGQAAQHTPLPHLLADAFDRLAAEGRHGPVGFEAGDLVDEVGQQLCAVGRMDDFGMKHGGEDAALLVGRDGEGRVVADAP